MFNTKNNQAMQVGTILQHNSTGVKLIVSEITPKQVICKVLESNNITIKVGSKIKTGHAAMKKAILIISLVFISFCSYSQTEKIPHDSTTTEIKVVANVEYKVYKGTKGGKYLARISKKTGKYYRQYLKKED